MPTPKGKKELKAEKVLTDLAALRAAFDKVKSGVPASADGFDIADQSDNLGHYATHLQGIAGHLTVLEGQAEGWRDREKAAREAKDKAAEEE